MSFDLIALGVGIDLGLLTFLLGMIAYDRIRRWRGQNLRRRIDTVVEKARADGTLDAIQPGGILWIP